MSNRVGRRPAGIYEGECVQDYPQVTAHVPPDIKFKLNALVQVLDQPQWRVMVKAIDVLVESLGHVDRALFDQLCASSIACQAMARPERDLVRVARRRHRAKIHVDDNVTKAEP